MLYEEVGPNWQSNIPFDVENMLGKILVEETEGPGVYYIAARGKVDSHIAQEYYIVTTDSPAVSQAAKTYGHAISGHADLLLYSFEEEHGGYKIIEYEIARYRVENGIPLQDTTSLRDIKLFGMCYHPEYFGPHPVPPSTPTGQTVRHWTIENGVYQLETNGGRQYLAICYPIWSTELSDYALKISQQTAHDRNQGVKNTRGYLFFSPEDSCIPIFEMLLTHSEWIEDDKINFKALMNAVWEYHPQYAAVYNLREQTGHHDMLGLLLRRLGKEDVELKGSQENMITLSPEVGTEFLSFPV